MKEPQIIYDIAIVGGGAAGLAAAISAANTLPSLKIVVLEKNDRVGKKLITTGNGRCNLSNRSELYDRYHGDTAFAKAVLKNVSVEETLEFFKDIDIPTVMSEENKLFPLSLQAGAVVDALRFAAVEKGVEMLMQSNVSFVKFEKDNDYFKILNENKEICSKKVLVCTGGKAAPKTGSDGSGYDLLTALGHRLTDIFPTIVQITTETTNTKALKGIKTEAEVTVIAGETRKTEKGELLFTEYGISGPPVLQLSRIVAENKKADILIDMLPMLSNEKLICELKQRIMVHPQRELQFLLLGILHSRLGQTVLKISLGNITGKTFSDLSKTDILKIIHNIKRFSLIATGTLSWNNAQATAGGIDTAEFDNATMESRKIKGLFAAGEVLNVDGDCGGFNLQWAWSSGILAGKSMAKALL